jgi:hypothetical protein
MCDYTWIGKPIQKNAGATRTHGGTGAWVRNKLLNRVSRMQVNHQHKDILWLKVIGNRQVMYIAVVYSNPKNINNHKLILKTMRNNEEELAKSGTVVVVGDFNSRLNEMTGDRNKHPSNYDRAMRAFLAESKLVAATNETQIKQGEHWTFVGRSAGRSVNDYLLAPKGLTLNYRVHQDVNFGSQHRMITASLLITHSAAQWQWGTKASFKCTWDETTTSAYAEHLSREDTTEQLEKLAIKQEGDDSRQKRWIETEAKKLTNIISEAYESVAQKKEGKNTDHAGRTMKGENKDIEQLARRKRKLLNSITGTQDKKEVKAIWGQIQKTQADITRSTQQQRHDAGRQWWSKLKACPSPPDSREF